MKLTSKEIFPVDARDKLVAKLGWMDDGVSVFRTALEETEKQYVELNDKNNKLEQNVTYLKWKIRQCNKVVREQQKIINETNIKRDLPHYCPG